jgi:hypothetical protein
VELIEWRSIDVHSINSKSTFRPPQSGKRTTSYFACILGVRLHYRHHGEHGLKVRSEDKRIQYRSVPQKGGFYPCSFHLIFGYVPIKIYFGNLYTAEKILSCSFRWCSPFFVKSFFRGNIFFRKTYSIQYPGRFRHQQY